MSDDDAERAEPREEPAPEPATARTPEQGAAPELEAAPAAEPTPEAPADPERALEQALYVETLELTVEELRSQRAELIEALRAARPRTGTEAVRFEVRTLLREWRRDLHVRAAAAPGLPLASLPMATASAVPRWEPGVDILGDVRPAFLADPPASYRWDLDVPGGCAVSGAVALKPGAWLRNIDGIEFIIELSTPDGELASTFVLGLDPTGREEQRRWVPWRVPLPGAGRFGLTLRTRPVAGASGDFAWAVVGDPRVEAPGLRETEHIRPLVHGRGKEAMRVARARLRRDPVISLLLPVHDPPPGLLDRTLDAVQRQTSPRWRLCIVDDGSTDRLVRERLERAAAEDPRVRLLRHDVAKGISGATNAALTLATTEFVATLDHDDLLAPDAIEVMARFLGEHPDTDVLYSDNDMLFQERRFSAALKPAWSPDLMRAVMYTLHFSAYRRSAIQAVGGWRSAYDGAQDHDLVLRLSEHTDRIRHLPRVLYHWRAHAGSASLGAQAKPLAADRGRAAIVDHLRRTAPAGTEVERLPYAGRYRVRYPRTRPVTVVIPVRGDAADAELVPTLCSLLATLRSDDRMLLVSVGSAPEASDAANRAVSELADPRVSHPAAVAGADGTRASLGGILTIATRAPADHTVVLMERAVAPTSGDAIDELAGRVEAGAEAAGGVVVSDHERLVAGALVFPQGLPMPAHPDVDLSAGQVHPSLTMASNRLAVRGVVAVSSAVLARHHREARSLDRLAFGGLTLAAQEAGGRVVWSPHARFRADEAVAAELVTWPLADVKTLDRGQRPDPFWNALLWQDRADGTVPESVHEIQLPHMVDA